MPIDEKPTKSRIATAATAETELKMNMKSGEQ